MKERIRVLKEIQKENQNKSYRRKKKERKNVEKKEKKQDCKEREKKEEINKREREKKKRGNDGEMKKTQKRGWSKVTLMEMEEKEDESFSLFYHHPVLTTYKKDIEKYNRQEYWLLMLKILQCWVGWLRV